MRLIGLSAIAALLLALAATAAAQAPVTGTERPDPSVVAQLRSGPSLPYAVDTSWPKLPKGYNFGPCSAVDVDAQGHVWVFNRGSWPVMEFDREGNLLQAWSAESFRVTTAHGLRVAPDGNLWCVDVDGHVILKVNREGRVLMILGKRQGVPGNNESVDGFQRPTNVAFLPNGHLYIADGYLNSRVVEVTADGDYVRQWGRPGRGEGEFAVVHDVAIDARGRVYIADRNNERIQVFAPDGTFITQWTGLGSPWGLCYVASEEALYMGDGKYGRIVKLSLQGDVLGTLGAYGKAPGRLDYVHSLAVDPVDGSIYTAEVSTARIQKWVRR